MPTSHALDSTTIPLALPYDKLAEPLDEKRRIVAGLNMMVSPGGLLETRFGTVAIPDTEINQRCDRLWKYETLEVPRKLFWLGSFYNALTEKWQMFYNRPAAHTGWVDMTSGALNPRDIDKSVRPHEVVFARGKAYIVSWPPLPALPAPAEPEEGVYYHDQHGTHMFDGSGTTPTLWPWGVAINDLEGYYDGSGGRWPQAKVKGGLARLSASLTSSATTLTVRNLASWGSATAPFDIQCEFETMTVTSVGSDPFLTWTVTRAVKGTVAAAHDIDSIVLRKDWTASGHRIDVKSFWGYVYSLVLATGHVCNISEVETNVDKMPSFTGPFSDLCPTIIIHGHGFTEMIPYINVYRTTDGGGQPYFLERIANPGFMSFEYRDDSLATGTDGATTNDPVPDKDLDVSKPAPDYRAQGHLPRVLAPKIYGVDEVDPGGPPSYYAGRIWFPLENTLVYSANEESVAGIPEDSFPGGIRGNSVKFQHTVLGTLPTEDGLYVLTAAEVHAITGTTKQTFFPIRLYSELGMAQDQRRALAAFGKRAAFLSHDYRLILLERGKRQDISDLLGDDLRIAIEAGAQIQLTPWTDTQRDYLVVSAHRADDSIASRQWVLDITRSVAGRDADAAIEEPFWFTPWDIRSSCTLASPISEDSSRQHLVFAIWEDGMTKLVRLDTSGETISDATTDGDVRSMSFYFDTHQVSIPPGNHVNALRKPGLSPVVHEIHLRRLVYGSESDPQVSWYRDDLWTIPLPLTRVNPPARRRSSKGFRTMVMPVNKIAFQAAVKVAGENLTNRMSLESLTIVFNPEGGA